MPAQQQQLSPASVTKRFDADTERDDISARHPVVIFDACSRG
jgi:hypothetical protein